MTPTEPATTAAVPAQAFGHAMKTHWPLDPTVTYLNHGTVGVVPRRVLAAQQAIRDQIERNPARFLLRELADVGEVTMRMPPRMRTAAATVAHYVHADPADLAFVDNATTGCNAVLRSFPFAKGDELLATDHGYGAVTNAARYVAQQTGAALKIVELPFPATTPGAIVQAIEGALGKNTKLIVIDHVCSGSALVLPVAEIAARCRARGVATLVDGAHVPGMLALDVPALDADFYTANMHKWAMAPRSCGILWAAPERQANLHPTVISWGYTRGMSAEFDLVGTRDPSPWLAAPDGIEFLRSLGDEALKAYNHALVWEAAQALTRHWGTKIPAPEAMYGSMVTIPLPAKFGDTAARAETLKTGLLYEDGIETQIHAFRGTIWLRLAAQVYNEMSDFERLREALDRRV